MLQPTGGVEDDKMDEKIINAEKAEGASTLIDKECIIAPLTLSVQSEPLREKKASKHHEKQPAKTQKQEAEAVPSKATTIGQSIDIDEDTEYEFIPATLNHGTNRRPSSFEPYVDPSVLLWAKTVANEANNMRTPIPNFSHPICISESPPPQLPPPDLSPSYPPPAHFTDPTHNSSTDLQHPSQCPTKTLLEGHETDLHSIYDLYSTHASKPSKKYIAHFSPPPTSKFSVPSPPQSHLNFSPSKPKEKRTNWALEEHFPFTPLQRMSRKHRKRLYGALFAIFFVSTLGAGVGFLIHGVGDGKRASASNKDRPSTELASMEYPNGSETSARTLEGKKEHILWMVITGAVLVGCHAIFACVMFVLYGPCGTRRKRYVRDGKGGAVELPRRVGS